MCDKCVAQQSKLKWGSDVTDSTQGECLHCQGWSVPTPAAPNAPTMTPTWLEYESKVDKEENQIERNWASETHNLVRPTAASSAKVVMFVGGKAPQAVQPMDVGLLGAMVEAEGKPKPAKAGLKLPGHLQAAKPHGTDEDPIERLMNLGEEGHRPVAASPQQSGLMPV